MAIWYVGSTKYTAVAQWAASTAYTVGQIVRQLATPAVGSERCFLCVTAGTSSGTEPSWTTTKNATNTDGTVTWRETTGVAAVNGDATNTTTWAASTARAAGDIIKNVAATHYFTCSTAGTSTSGAEPGWNTTTGATTTDGSAQFKCIGAVGSFTAYGAPAARVNPFTTFLAFAAVTDTVYVSNNHAETQSSAINYSLTTTPNVICVSDTVVPPTTLAYTASVTTTGASNLAVISGFWSGIVFNAATGAVTQELRVGRDTSTNSYGARLRRCQLNNLGTSGGSITINGDSETLDCDMTFGSTAAGISLANHRGNISGGTIAATGTVPTVLITSLGAGTTFRGVDLSAVNTTLVGPSATPTGEVVFHNCKLHASATSMTQPTSGLATTALRMYDCDSGATNYKFSAVGFAATCAIDTSIVRTGGATDGTTPVSHAVTTSANAGLRAPYALEEIVRWNDTTGSSKTATIELTTNTALTEADAWLSVEYLGSSATPLSTFASSRVLVGPAALTTSSSTWGGTAKTFKYKISVTFTPQMKGPVKYRLFLAKPSATVYVDPLITVV